MTEEQIKHMAQRFLGWKLPESFNPDGGISFKKTFNEHMPHPSKHEPTGTNLFGYDQALAMARYMVDDLPQSQTDARVTKVIPFTGITSLDMPPDYILETAKGNLEGVVIIGYRKDGEEYFASSYADGGTVNWLLDRCKQKLLNVMER